MNRTSSIEWPSESNISPSTNVLRNSVKCWTRSTRALPITVSFIKFGLRMGKSDLQGRNSKFLGPDYMEASWSGRRGGSFAEIGLWLILHAKNCLSKLAHKAECANVIPHGM